MVKPVTRNVRRLVHATRYSFTGLRAAWRNEEAFRLESLLGAALLPCALWLGENAVQRALLIGSCLVVVITELLNSAVESIVDRIGAQRHELSGRAKDLGSAAVFISLVLVVVVWTLIAWDRFTG